MSHTTAANFAQATENAAYQLRFESLFDQGRALAFPCDDHGCVHMDSLSDRARSNYLYARAVVGREFCAPTVTRHYAS